MSGRTTRFKVVLLGEGRVGKTSIVVRYVKGEYDDRNPSTLQASFLRKTLNVAGASVELAIWDTAGQERFHALTPIYYRNADGALIVYDITDQDSWSRAQHWVRELRKMDRPIQIAMAGNKCDLEKSRAVSAADVEAFAASVGAVHILCSAKLNKGLQEIFLELTKRLVENQKKSRGGGGGGGARGGGARGGGGGGGGGGGRSAGTITFADDDLFAEAPEKKPGCC